MRTLVRWPRTRKMAPVSLIAAGIILVAAMVGIVYGLWTQTLGGNANVSVGYTNADFIDAWTDDPPGNPDPGYTKDVATCTAEVVSEEEVRLLIDNAYPSYTCTFTTVIMNGGTVPERREPLEFEVSPVLTVTELTDLTGEVLRPGEEDEEVFTVHVEKEAAPGMKYTFTIRKPFSLFVTGTIGFWKKWDSHNTYTQAEIEGWLWQISDASAWYNWDKPVAIGDMKVVIMDALGGSGTPETRFLAQCLATRLNVFSGRLDGGDTYDVSGEDPLTYLGLGTSATLNEILDAIEAKYGTSPTNTEFNIMKNICDKLNNLDL